MILKTNQMCHIFLLLHIVIKKHSVSDSKGSVPRNSHPDFKILWSEASSLLASRSRLYQLTNITALFRIVVLL